MWTTSRVGSFQPVHPTGETQRLLRFLLVFYPCPTHEAWLLVTSEQPSHTAMDSAALCAYIPLIQNSNRYCGFWKARNRRAMNETILTFPTCNSLPERYLENIKNKIYLEANWKFNLECINFCRYDRKFCRTRPLLILLHAVAY